MRRIPTEFSGSSNSLCTGTMIERGTIVFPWSHESVRRGRKEEIAYKFMGITCMVCRVRCLVRLRWVYVSCTVGDVHEIKRQGDTAQKGGHAITCESVWDPKVGTLHTE